MEIPARDSGSMSVEPAFGMIAAESPEIGFGMATVSSTETSVVADCGALTGASPKAPAKASISLSISFLSSTTAGMD